MKYPAGVVFALSWAFFFPAFRLSCDSPHEGCIFTVAWHGGWNEGGIRVVNVWGSRIPIVCGVCARFLLQTRDLAAKSRVFRVPGNITHTRTFAGTLLHFAHPFFPHHPPFTFSPLIPIDFVSEAPLPFFPQFAAWCTASFAMKTAIFRHYRW